ncbi:MAG TPA: acyl-CoA carboxylase subunit beta [Desulfatiglandales bacterium]|nr:acyl-CoA carboxylase subunit beta [Desulfatiglandales bacterium]
MSNSREKKVELEQLKKRYELGGGPEAIEKVHAKGKLTARERVELFADPGSFREFNLWAQPTKTGFDIDKRDNPGDAVVTGFARVDGRPVCVYAHDFTVLGGSQAPVQHWKICKAMNTAVKMGIPYIGIIDSAGVRIYDAFGINSGAGMGRNADVWYSPSMASGIVPSISLTLGASYAGTAYSPFLADVLFMVKKPYCYMSLASPELLKSVTFKDVTREEIGAPQLHAEITGSCDYLGETEEDVLQKGRELLSFLPSNCREKPPILDTGDNPGRIDDTLIDIVLNNPKEPYDMHEVISRVVDNGYFFELKSEYAKNIIVGFGRLGGRSVGIVANNPLFINGALDFRAVEKEARFIRYCDAYNVPLVFLVDTPGFFADPKQERDGFVRHAAMVSYAICEATVPKITVYIGRCYNNAHMAMGTRLMGVDVVLAWPMADIKHVDFDESLEAVYGKRPEDLEPDEIEEFSKKYFDSPRQTGALLMLDDIINPAETRPNLISFLEITERKEVIGPNKKHGNMPL